jgi:hypothetical protein
MDLKERRAGLRHPWEQARARFFLDVLADRGLLSGAPRVLDAGSGDAWFAGQLRARSPDARVTCWDVGYQDPELGARDGLRFVRDRPAEPFDVALLLDVMEHVDDDAGFLGAIVRENLPPGSHALVSVPCWQVLFSSHDRALEHRRRYTPAQARSVLAGAGLDVVVGGGLFHSLLVPRAASTLVERARGAHEQPAAETGAWRGGALLTRVVAGALVLEGRLSRAVASRGVEAPGLSWWALARRPG